MTTSILGISFYTSDARPIAAFWAGTLGRTVNPGATEEFAAIAAPDGTGPTLMFHKVPEKRRSKTASTSTRSPAASKPKQQGFATSAQHN